MADKAREIKELNELQSEKLRGLQAEMDLRVREYDQVRATLDLSYREQQAQEGIRLSMEMQEERQRIITELKKEGKRISDKVTDLMQKQDKIYDDLNKKQKTQNSLLQTSKKLYKDISGLAKLTWDYLMESDKAMKQTILSLGMSGAKAEEMRASFKGSAGYVARLGGSLSDVGTIMTTFANETGLARTLSAEMVQDITKIGRGTAIGVENAAKLAAQFEYMGLDVKSTMEYVQGVVETSELMGVNTTKVMDNINTNFKQLQKFTFIQGVKGFAQMASYAEKFSVDMTQALTAAEHARSLENAVDLAAQLQVMGGEFAKTDPFQLLFLSRNDPAAFTQKINEMTKGVVQFRKMTDSAGKTVFEKFISPADRDRLAAVAKSLGMQTEELVEQSLRMADIQKMRQQMIGMGLSDEQKEIVEGMAKFDSKLGRYIVTVAGHKRDITDLTSSELEVLKETKSSLEQRALNAQTFDEAFKATIEEMKTALLPLLMGVNATLEWMRPTITKWTESLTSLTEGGKQWVKVAGAILAGGFVLNKAVGLVAGLVGKIGQYREIFTGGGDGGGVASSGARARARRGAGNALKRGKGTALAGVGVGAAALGVGAGIGAAAGGISLLADALDKLDVEKAEILQSIVTTLAISIGVTAAAAVGIIALGSASLAASPGLGALSLAVLGIGAGIGIAATGIGAMAVGIGVMAEKSKGAGNDLLKVGAGITAIGAGLALAGLATANPLGAIGMAALAATLGLVAATAPRIEAMGPALESITQLKGMAGDLRAVESMIKTISNANLDKLKSFSALKDLKGLFDKPLKVEFADKEVAIVSNVTLKIDGYEFYEKTSGAAHIAENTIGIQQGKQAR